MGTLFGFVVGYIVGARSGSRGFDQLVQAARDVWESREFRGLMDALRLHAKETADDLNQRLQRQLDGEGAMDVGSMLDAARARMRGTDD